MIKDRKYRATGYRAARWLILTSWLFSSCTPHHVTPSEDKPATAPTSTVRVKQDESLDPLALGGEDFIKVPESPQKPTSPRQVSSEATNKETTNSGTVEMPGFRVQLFASDVEPEARAYEEKALLDFNEDVYITFEIPLYKVRIGDCRTRAEANLLRQEAENKGYSGAWVVRCKVLITNP